jgi:hypothetical protein
MLDRAYRLREVRLPMPSDSHLTWLIFEIIRQPIGLFVATADQRFGPITTIRCNGRVEKQIPWTAFTMTDGDWRRVREAADILAVSL